MMERYAQVLQQLQLVQHAIQHTYDAAHDECDALDAQMPAEYYITALKQLCEHRDNLVKEMEYIRQEEIIEDELSGEEESIIYIVKEVTKDHVVLDGNHPFAGIDVVFHGVVADVRQATKEEIKEQYAR